MAKVLVVDETKVVACVVAQMLKTRGHETEAVSTPEEAKRLIAEYDYDLILADAGICARLGLREGSKPDTPLVVMAAMPVDQTTRQNLEDIGANGFISKPFTIDQIDEAVRKVTAAS